jgi:hypothetical protein
MNAVFYLTGSEKFGNQPVYFHGAADLSQAEGVLGRGR